ncbi:hypothetical protein [Streptomyces sp. CBMA123]|uniref:hypothetical protein n=1 Tax=Streptomyces sp. CBMA123 TaxID=1896313 RepID=UPI001661BF77|nr:hypothetical protein [Streptomyces sp. CBMA123]MBD0693611.1 hypothetical protein [Streptomyces sp. CBMA123]
MSNSFHFGDSVTQHGNHNIGIVKNQGPVDPQAALRELVTAVRQLRDQVPAEDREVLDESLEAIGDGAEASPSALRRALRNISGVASLVRAGAPVVESVRRILDSLSS